MKPSALIIVVVTSLAGCAYNVTLMPRDSGRTFTGELHSDGGGSGTMSVMLDDGLCTGPAARVASNQSFGFANTYGSNTRGQFASAFSTISIAGDTTVKAILSCAGGSGLRCDMTGRDATAGGVCVDDKGRVFDVLVIRK